MASIKVKFRPSNVADREGTIYYQIIHERRVRQITSKHHVYSSEWDEKRSMVTTSAESVRKPVIISVREQIRFDLERIVKIIRQLENSALRYTADDIVDSFNRYLSEYSVFNYMERIILMLRKTGRIRTAETYTATLNSFKKFRSGEDLMLDSISTDIMSEYEVWHKNRGNCPNTISFYTRILRAVYNRAVEEDVIENRNPFRHVYTGIDKTVKRALPLQTVKKIKQLDLIRYPQLDYARDMFLLSFYLRGMSFIDMAFLRKSDLRNGYITYRRHKTGQCLVIEWTSDMQIILDKYPPNNTVYLLPILRKQRINEICAYRRAGNKINYNLKKIAAMAGISIPLTLYVARHSWASAARAKGIPLSVISEGMGHDSESTTQIYLASLDTSSVDRANSIILRSLR